MQHTQTITLFNWTMHIYTLYLLLIWSAHTIKQIYYYTHIPTIFTAYMVSTHTQTSLFLYTHTIFTDYMVSKPIPIHIHTHYIQ